MPSFERYLKDRAGLLQFDQVEARLKQVQEARQLLADMEVTFTPPADMKAMLNDEHRYFRQDNTEAALIGVVDTVTGESHAIPIEELYP